MASVTARADRGLPGGRSRREGPTSPGGSDAPRLRWHLIAVAAAALLSIALTLERNQGLCQVTHIPSSRWLAISAIAGSGGIAISSASRTDVPSASFPMTSFCVLVVIF